MAVETQVTITEKAAEELRKILKESGKEDKALRIYVQGGGCSGFQYGMNVDEEGKTPSDQEFESNGIKILVDPISIRYITGAVVDYIENPAGSGFSILNPRAKSTCGCGSSFSTEEQDDNHD